MTQPEGQPREQWMEEIRERIGKFLLSYCISDEGGKCPLSEDMKNINRGIGMAVDQLTDPEEAAELDRDILAILQRHVPKVDAEALEHLQATFKRLDSKYGRDWTEWQDVRDAISDLVRSLASSREGEGNGHTE